MENEHYKTCTDHTGRCQVVYRPGEIVHQREIIGVHYQRTEGGKLDGVALLYDPAKEEYVIFLAASYGELYAGVHMDGSDPKAGVEARQAYARRVAQKLEQG